MPAAPGEEWGQGQARGQDEEEGRREQGVWQGRTEVAGKGVEG